jgi:hypothetical protein
MIDQIPPSTPERFNMPRYIVSMIDWNVLLHLVTSFHVLYFTRYDTLLINVTITAFQLNLSIISRYFCLVVPIY